MITLALIGIGKWGKNYLSTIKAFPECEIKYVCSESQQSLQELEGDFIKTINYRDLLKFKDIDGVIIATPGSTHYQIAKEFLKEGFNLLIEKPLSIDYKQALDLKKIRDETNASVLVGHVYLFDPAFVQMKELTKQIGSLRYITYEIMNNGPYRRDVSALWDLGPHAISLLLEIYEQTPINIQAWGHTYLRPKTELFDVITIKMEFSNQCFAFVNINWLSPIKRRELIVVGTESTLLYNDLNHKRLILFENIGPRTEKESVIKNLPTIKYPVYENKPPLECELSEFINAIAKKQIIKRSNLDFGIIVTQILNLVEESIRKGGDKVDVKI